MDVGTGAEQDREPLALRRGKPFVIELDCCSELYPSSWFALCLAFRLHINDDLYVTVLTCCCVMVSSLSLPKEGESWYKEG